MIRTLPERARARAVAAALALLTVLVFARASGFAFVDLDDPGYVLENDLVRHGLTGAGVAGAFTQARAQNWHPVTWLSHMLDVELFGLDPRGHHAVSVLLHLANVLLLFHVLRAATGATWRSALAAALFAVHPLRAESVAWVSERKDVLSMLFLLLAIRAHLAFVRAPGAGRYALVALALALGLMSKPMLVTAPLLLLLLDVWPLGRTRAPDGGPAAGGLARLALEKAPLLALSAASSAATWLVQSRAGAAASLGSLPLGERVANALWSYVAYLGKALWPVDLAAFYPHPAIVAGGTPAWKVALALAVLGAISAAAVAQRRRRPWLLFGWLWYLGALVPVIGIVQVGAQAMADRYTYVPMIGPAVAAAWAAGELAASGARARLATAAGAAAAVLALAALAARQVETWRDGLALNAHALSVTERNWQAFIGLGDALLGRGRPAEAAEAYRQAIAYVPAAPEAWNGLGAALGALGREGDALAAFERAVRLRPDDPHAWYNLGTAHGRAGRHARAAECLREALRLRPDDERAWGNLAVASAALGDQAEAARALERLASLSPARAAELRRELGVR